MSAKNDAFVTVPCKCPICQMESRHRYVKSKLFTPEIVEDDQHVVKYKWESPMFEGIRPNFYHIWHCPTCHFCDESSVFRGKDDSGGKLELIQERLLIAQRSPNNFVSRLGKFVDMNPEYIPMETALCAHMLAIFIQEMLTPNNRQYAKLARLYLRTSWLYREKSGWVFPEQNLPEGFDSYAEFFQSLQQEWPNIPLDERAAMEKAIECYNEDLNRATGLDDIKREITVMFLLVDLQLRLERLDEAHKIVRHVFQKSTGQRQSTRKALDHGVKEGKLNGKQIETMRNLLQWLNNTIERATDLSDKVNDLIFKEEYPKARELILTLENPTPKLVLERLKSEGFHTVTCRRIEALFRKKKKGDTDAGQKADGQKNESQDELEKKASESQEKKKSGFWNQLFKKAKK